MRKYWRDLIEGIRVMGFWRCMYARNLYRPHMRFIHKRGQHWFKVVGPLYPEGNTYERCKWHVSKQGQSEIIDKIDELCITRDFEEWANLAPFMPLSKDGDGEYEDVLTKRFFACFEAAYKKGMWGASRKINNNLVDEVERLRKLEYRPCTGDCHKDFLAWQETQGGNITQDNYEAWKAGYETGNAKCSPV